MKKLLLVKLEDFDINAKKLLLGEILDIAEEVAKNGYLDGLAVIMEQAKENGWLKTIQDNREIANEIITAAVIFPEGKTINHVYPEELLVIFPAIMEVNNGFLEVMEVSQSSKVLEEKVPQEKSSKTSKAQ